MTLQNVVCFGPEEPYIHDHVLSAKAVGLFKRPDRFRLDEWPDRPRPGMLARPALITYVPAHGGWLDGVTSAPGVKEAWAPFSDFGPIGGEAVVLDACSTASDDWLYDQGRLLPECQSLKCKPLLGGSGDKEPQKGHGEKILAALVDVLSGIEDTAMTKEKLRALLTEVWRRAIARAVSYSTIRAAYKVRMVTPTI
jgi:hypothetical protein